MFILHIGANNCERCFYMTRRRHLRGSLRLEGRTWINRYPGTDGHEQRMVIGSKADYPTKSAARVAADRRMADINPSMNVHARSTTLKAFSTIYIEDAIANMKPTAAKSAKSLLLLHVVPTLGHLVLEDVAGRWPQVLVNAMHAKQCSNKTISNALVVVSRLMKLARRYSVPCADFARWMVKMPAAEPPTPRRCFTPDEAMQIVVAADAPWNVLFALYAHCGFRRGEGLAFTWNDINFADRVIHVRRNAVLGQLGTVKSHHSRRDVAMSQSLYDVLQQYRLYWVPNESGLLFADERGLPWQGDHINDVVLTPLLKRLGIPHGGLHAFRHGHSTNLLRAGVAVSTTKELLGHADIKTTVGYAHTVIDDKRNAQDKISALLSIGETRRTAEQATQENKA